MKNYLQIHFKKSDKQISIPIDPETSDKAIGEFIQIISDLKYKSYYEDENIRIYLWGGTLLERTSSDDIFHEGMIEL